MDGKVDPPRKGIMRPISGRRAAIYAFVFAVGLVCMDIYLTDEPLRASSFVVLCAPFLLVFAIATLREVRKSQSAGAAKGLAIAALVLVAVCIPPGVRGCQQQQFSARDMRTQCLQNIDAVMRAMEQYRAGFGAFPSNGIPGDSDGSLALLYPRYISDPRVLICPFDRGQENKEHRYGGGIEWSPGPVWCSYFYNNVLPQDPASAYLILCDKRSHPDWAIGGRSVAESKGSCFWLSDDNILLRWLVSGRYPMSKDAAP